MKSWAPFTIGLLALAGQSVHASQTLCIFEGSKAQQFYELEFIGYDDTHPTIVFSATAFESGKRTTLPPRSYTLKKFSPKTATVHLDFRNPDDSARPSSFTLIGAAGHAKLTMDHNVVTGSMKCSFSGSAH